MVFCAHSTNLIKIIINLAEANQIQTPEYIRCPLEPLPRSLILLGSNVSMLLADESGTKLYITLRIPSRPVRHYMLDTAYRCAVNIAAGIDDLEGFNVGLVITYMLPTIASMFDCIAVVCNLLGALD